MQPTFLSPRSIVCFAALTAALSGSAMLPQHATGADDTLAAETVLAATGVKGGLAVQLGCGDGELLAGLHDAGHFLVHGLDRDAAIVAKVRERLNAAGIYGDVSVESLTGDRLPYTDNLVNLLVVDGDQGISNAEILRALVPGGVAYVGDGDRWTKTVKPRPREIDEWTHFLHGPDNNAVAQDSVVGPPQHIQWIGGPRWARGHEVLASISSVVTAGGRIFYIADEGPIASVDLPSSWFLVARDAFNGVQLWQRPIPKWESSHRPFRSGPTHLPRRLVAIGDEVFVTLGFEEPLVSLDAATGEIAKTYEGTDGTEEILFDDGTLYLVAGDLEAQRATDLAVRRGETLPPVPKTIMAVNAKSGERLWQKSDDDTADQFAQSLAVKDGRVFFQNTRAVICLDAATGEQLWSSLRPAALQRPAWSVPTLVVYDDVVISADRKAPDAVPDPSQPQRVDWTVSFAGGNAPLGEMIAFSTKTGQRVWTRPCQEGYNAPVDVLLADGLLWSGNLVKAGDPGITQALDPASGKVERTRPRDQQFFNPGMSHHRCYRNRATERFIVMGRSGVELLDVKTGKAVANHWVRGTCQFGVLPANGMVYVPPHTCACYIKTKLNGFNALAPAREHESDEPTEPQLQQGPAYADASNRKSKIANRNSEDWPTYRHDAARSGVATTGVSPELTKSWEADLGGALTSVVAADGMVFVAQTDRHTVHALSVENGQTIWGFTTGGRIDSPPTIAGGLVYFGSADSWMYCVRADDGQLAWRFRAGPEDRRVIVDGGLESPWPISGSVLVQNDRVYFAAGRSSFLDGGIYLYALDRHTGEVVHQNRVSGRDPKTGEQPKEIIKGFDMPGGLPDVLSSDGANVFMRDLMFDDQCVQQESAQPHVFTPTGFLDDSWWHRSYWIFGNQFNAGWPGWDDAGNEVPAGRLLVFDDKSIYGFGRSFYASGNAGQWKQGEYYRLYAASKQLQPTKPQPKSKPKGRPKRNGPVSRVNYQWSERVEPTVRAMLLSGDTLFIAGPRGETHKELAAFEGSEGISLQAISAADGSVLAKYELDSLPVFDGMAAADGKLFLSTRDGKLLCFVAE